MVELRKVTALLFRVGCWYSWWLAHNTQCLVSATLPHPSAAVFYSAVPTPCGRRDDLSISKSTPLHRLSTSQRHERIADWFKKSLSVGSAFHLYENHADLQIEEELIQQSILFSSEKQQQQQQQHDGTTTIVAATTTNNNILDPYETWWNGKVSLYRILRKKQDDRILLHKEQEPVVDENDSVDRTSCKIIVASTACEHLSSSAACSSPMTVLPPFGTDDHLYFVLSPRIVATSVCHQISRLFHYLLRQTKILFQQRFETTTTCPAPQQERSFSFTFDIALYFERMYVGFAIIFFLHYFYLLKIVLSRSAKGRDHSSYHNTLVGSSTSTRKHHHHQELLLTTLDAVVEEDEDDEKEWENRIEKEELYQRQFEELVGREFDIAYSNSPICGADGARNGTSGGRPLSSVATATTLDAFSFLEDSDSEQQEEEEDDYSASSSSSSSEYSFPSRCAAADWYYYQEELQEQHQ